MSRVCFEIGYGKKEYPVADAPPGTTKTVVSIVSLISCALRVAKGLTIDGFAYKGVNNTGRVRAAYSKQVLDATGAEVAITIPEGLVALEVNPNPKMKKVILTRGLISSVKKKHRHFTITFPQGMKVAIIGEILAELIPDAIINRDGLPTATQILPTFKIVGGRSHPIPLRAEAAADASVVVPTTPAAEAALDQASKPQTSSSGKAAAGP